MTASKGTAARGALQAALMAILLGCAAAQAADQHWRRIDFDADLTSYLLDMQSVQRTGDIASVKELNVPGRTSISTGAEHHSIVQRLFDCKAGTQKLGEVLLYRDLKARAEKIPHEDPGFKVEPGSIDDIEFQYACHGRQPAQTEATVEYASVEQAVRKAFADAIKLPREQSNRTLKGFPPGGPPPQAPGN
ncbi:MAG: hypothetical protein QM718_11720 [Steroidobacteraceae bacterium]